MHIGPNFPDIEISAFAPYRNREGHVVPGIKAKTVLLYRELFRFKEGYYSLMTEQLRSLKTKEERNKYKLESFPAFTISCHFKDNDYRKQTNISNYTNLICFDIDFNGAADFMHKEKKKDPKYHIGKLRDMIYNEIPCLFAGISCSGEGVFFIVKYKPSEHEDVFFDMEDYLLNKYNIKIDAACKDYARLRFATHDPKCHITPFSQVKTYELRNEYLEKKLKIKEYKESKRDKVVIHHTTDVAGVIMERAVNIIRTSQEGERHNKIRAASRLAGGYIATNLLEENYVRDKLVEAVVSINYDDMRDAQKAIDYGISAGKLNPLEVNIITPDDPQFDFFIKQDEIRQREIRELYHEIRTQIRKGVAITRLDLVDLGSRFLVDTERIQTIAYRLYEKFSYEFDIDNKPPICRVEAYLTGKYEFRRDIITDTSEFRIIGSSDWQFLRFEDLWREITQIGYKFKFEDLVRLFRSNYVKEINVWEEFFRSIPRKNKEHDYIDELASHVKITEPKEQHYWQMMFKKMLVRTLKCALDDNYANRTVLVLASPTQSNGKSSFIRWLNPFGVHQYFAENPLEDNKDSRIRMSETFIYNLEELSTISKFEINRLKAIISGVGTRDRKPYGRQAENIVRRCSFFGSTNRVTFLTDDTNTRWLCFEVKSIDWDYSKNIDKLQVWAQAYELYRNGYDCELNKVESDLRDVRNEKYVVTTIEEELVTKHFKPAKESDFGSQFLTSTAILEKLLLYTRETRMNITNVWVGRALAKQGFVRQRRGSVWGFYVIIRNQSDFIVSPNKTTEEPPF